MYRTADFFSASGFGAACEEKYAPSESQAACLSRSAQQWDECSTVLEAAKHQEQVLDRLGSCSRVGRWGSAEFLEDAGIQDTTHMSLLDKLAHAGILQPQRQTPQPENSQQSSGMLARLASVSLIEADVLVGLLFR
ncbi:hypothetical protein WJX72_010685 [[Myrmecia] bisecta]|uniref:Uncharacterized protein n=1 Tax=[Myrmecia] bisecta TaxID=41462 RepID=A0AAW1R968_9CHLO